MKIILYENNVKSLKPISLTRPVFDILSGSVTLFKIIEHQFGSDNISWIIRDYLEEVTARKYKKTEVLSNKILFLDGSLAPDFKMVTELVEVISQKENIIFKNNEKILGAYLNLESNQQVLAEIKNLQTEQVVEFLSGLDLETEQVGWHNFEKLWQVISFNSEKLKSNLNYIKSRFEELQKDIYVGKDVEISKGVFFDTSNGPIVINSGTKILPFNYLAGPLYIGSNCQVNEHSSLKHSCIGNTCKVGGEIEATIFQGYSNKQHFGFIGYSFIGEWVNLGAGTTNSDLKNTYSSIKMKGQDTGQRFLGCVIGDYTKTAINTSIFTGKVMGVSSNLLGAVTNDVPAFANFGSLLEKPVEFFLDSAIKSQKAMFARRNIKQSSTDVKLLQDVFNLTQNDRDELSISKDRIAFK